MPAALAGCLPALDPQLLATSCLGDAPDGFLDPGEECDDGNTLDGDGCDTLCHVECAPPGVKRPGTNRCYLPVGPDPPGSPATPERLRDLCHSSYHARLVTVRSAGERDFLAASVLASQPGLSLTAYQLTSLSREPVYSPAASPGSPSCPATSFLDAVPNPAILFQEPGVLAMPADPGLSITCSGCFFNGLSPDGSWFVDQAYLTLKADGGFHVYDPAAPDAPLAGALCERLPAGKPRNGCPGPSCPAGASAQIEIGASVYTYFYNPATWSDAEGNCASLGPGSHLWTIETEEERALVFDAFGAELVGRLAWVGLRFAGGGWGWVDGVASGDGGRPLLWASDPGAAPVDSGDQTGCAAMATQSSFGSFAIGLLWPMPCAVDPCSSTGSPGQASICKSPRGAP